MKYRPEIDGLRAVAILPVLFFHAGFEVFGGGYVGVDVFFVISGYLITSIILDEKSKKTFSFLHFYERRIRRIAPLLFLVLLFSLVVGYVLLMPSDYKQLGQSVVATLLFGSNYFFFAKSDYFDLSSELKPLLHTWSLSVEEQFYILLPLLLAPYFKIRRQQYILGLFIFVFLAIAFSTLEVARSPQLAFYSLHTRLWELCVGVLIAVLERHGVLSPIQDRYRLVCGWLGLSCIMLSIFVLKADSQFPGVYAAPAVVGAGLIIAFGDARSGVGKLLSYRPFVHVGVISFGLYLWHQPIYAFARYSLQGQIDLLGWFCILVSVYLLSVLTYVVVERPFRNRGFLSRIQVYSGAFVCALLLSLVSISIHVFDGYKFRLSSDQLRIVEFARYKYAEVQRTGLCQLSEGEGIEKMSPLCTLSKDAVGDKAKILIWGDSHAAALSYGFRSIFGHVSQYTGSNCPPVLGYKKQSTFCTDLNRYVLDKVALLEYDYIVLHANWLDYKIPENALFLANTLNQIKKISPKTQLFLVGPVPQWFPSLPYVLFVNKMPLSEGVSGYANHPERSQSTDKILAGIAQKIDGVGFVSVYDLICTDFRCPMVVSSTEGPVPFAWDAAHLTAGGSNYLAAKIVAALK